MGVLKHNKCSCLASLENYPDQSWSAVCLCQKTKQNSFEDIVEVHLNSRARPHLILQIKVCSNERVDKIIFIDNKNGLEKIDIRNMELLITEKLFCL